MNNSTGVAFLSQHWVSMHTNYTRRIVALLTNFNRSTCICAPEFTVHVLDSTFNTLDQINHVSVPLICSGFYSELFTSSGAMKHCTQFYMGKRLTAWLFTLADVLVSYLCALFSHSYEKAS